MSALISLLQELQMEATRAQQQEAQAAHSTGGVP